MAALAGVVHVHEETHHLRFIMFLRGAVQLFRHMGELCALIGKVLDVLSAPTLLLIGGLKLLQAPWHPA